jgi:hypothetical protein
MNERVGVFVRKSGLPVFRSESGGGEARNSRRHAQTGVESRAFAENPLAHSSVIRTKAIATSTIGMRAASSIRDGGESMQPT